MSDPSAVITNPRLLEEIANLGAPVTHVDARAGGRLNAAANPLAQRRDVIQEVQHIDVSMNVQMNVSTSAIVMVNQRKLIAVDSVIRSASYIVSATSIMSLVATILSDAIIIQPIFAILLLIASLGFYIMTFVRE